MLHDGIEKHVVVLLGGRVETALHHAAPVAMSRYLRDTSAPPLRSRSSSRPPRTHRRDTPPACTADSAG